MILRPATLTRLAAACLAAALLTSAIASADAPWDAHTVEWSCPAAAGPALLSVPQSPPAPSEVCSALRVTITDIVRTVCPTWGGSGGDDIDSIVRTWSWGTQPATFAVDPDPTYAYDFVMEATVDFDCIP